MADSPRWCGLFLVCVLALAPAALAQRQNADDALLDALVFAQLDQLSTAAYPAGIAQELGPILNRYSRLSPARGPSSPERPEDNLRVARERWRHTLTAISTDAAAASQAQRYVESWRLCYEWEGFHDCPETDARVADAYREAQPAGPLAEYLVLLAAHRWLCAAEGYTLEENQAGADASRRTYRARAAAAARARSVMIRTAAARLAARSTCFGR
jgi:hypothetical protein